MAVEAPWSPAETAPEQIPAASSTVPEAPSLRRVRRAQWERRLLIGLLVAILVAGFTGLFGTRTRATESTGNGYALQVHFASIARPGVAVPFDIQVQRDGGFDGAVTLTVSASYLSSIDAQSIEPEPQSTTSDGDLIVFQFQPPQGDTFGVSWEAEIDPAANMGRKEATVTVVGDDGTPATSVSIRTWVLP
jgi:hypothetical protein